MKLTSALPSWDCSNQRLFLRADLNVPLLNGQIMSERRLQAVKLTLDYLINHNARIILATHIGRPKNKEPKLSTKHLLPWFETNGYAIEWCADLDDAYTQSNALETGHILLLENLRFFAGEKDGSNAFAEQLACLADLYVNDAFATLHRNDTSITILPEQFEPQKRTIGFLVEKELTILNALLDEPQHPFCLVLGGAKVADKLPLIQHLLPLTDHILLCPAIVFTFAHAVGKPVGKSLINTELIGHAQTILQKAPQENTQIHFPVDYQIADKELSGPLSFTSAEQFPSNAIGISIGPQTAQQFASVISDSKTIFFNGSSGFIDRPETLQGVHDIFTAMAQSNSITIVAGGDSVSILDYFGITGITHSLTGGGATLTYLSGKPLPGLIPFID